MLPGFQPDTKFRMLKSLAEDVEIIIAINANDIEKNKERGDLGITYDEDVLRLADIYRTNGLTVAAVVLTQYAGQQAADVLPPPPADARHSLQAPLPDRGIPRTTSI